MITAPRKVDRVRRLRSSFVRVTTSTVTVLAPRGVVWEVITRPEFVRQWQYGSDLTTDWTVGAPIRFRAEWQGQDFEQWGTVLEFSPTERLRYSLFAPRPDLEDRPENYFTMTYELHDVGAGTAVTFIHEDPREVGSEVDESDDDNPVLVVLKTVAESIAKE
jgi:uncharacterized protein YndB with AHSA1/START domain